MNINKIVERFSTDNIQAATLGLLSYLGIVTDVITEEQIKITDIIEQPSKAVIQICNKIDESYLVCSISDRTFEQNTIVESFKDVHDRLERYEQLLVFAIDLQYNVKVTRSEMANLTRALNRASKASPVVVVYRYTDCGKIKFALSLCERTAYTQGGHTGEKAGKVNILRGIDPKNPHAGHLRILEDLRLEKKENTFEAVYSKWLKVFDNDVLTNKFYEELQNWYFWALKPESGISFPNDIDDEEDDKKYNPQNVIRLITRLIFVWFLKQKGLVPKALFEEEDLKGIIKDFEPENQKSNTYYRAILQNLFFATLNKKIEERAFVSDNFVENRNQGIHKIKTFMRHASDLKISKEEFIQLMHPVPFLNNSLFECLDNKSQNGHVYNWDGFSNINRSDRQAFVPNYLFFAEEAFVDLSKEYGRKKASSVKVVGLLNILKRYNFTVEENTPLDQDVALDPELLGKVFENLLAAYNPETETTVRKSTGSYYTPRPIVQYMVDESLVAYLKRTVPDVPEATVRDLLSYDDNKQDYYLTEQETQALAGALLNCKILDPACGSGAFPMGMLQQMSHLLGRVDTGNKYWEQVVLERALNDVSFIEKMSNEELDAHKREIEEVFNLSTDFPDYARKLYLIENCVYGVDLQTIATQISRLRFFISLLCEQQPDLSKPENNYNIKPLPNLEMKFVSANTLVRLEHVDEAKELFSNKDILELIDELKAIRHELFVVTDQHTKAKLLMKDEGLRQKIMLTIGESVTSDIEVRISAKKEILTNLEKELLDAEKMDDKILTKAISADLFGEKTETITYSLKEETIKDVKGRISTAKGEIKRLTESLAPGRDKAISLAKKLTDWNPYDQNVSSPFFDPEWMFGVKEGFDIVIGNPPYGVSIKGSYRINVVNSLGHVPDYEIYYYFIQAAEKFIKYGGILSYIIPNTYLFNTFANIYRISILENWNILEILDCTKFPIFDKAVVRNTINMWQKQQSNNLIGYRNTSNIRNFNDLISRPRIYMQTEDLLSLNQNWGLAFMLTHDIIKLLYKIKFNKKSVIEYFPEISQGLIAYDKYQGQSDEIIKNRVYHFHQYRDGLKEWLWGEDVTRYSVQWNQKEYLDYCSGIANPRNPKFFKGKRMLVREITNPSIYAAITEKEQYNDPAIIIVKDSDCYSIYCLLGIINSKLATFYHFNHSPKATKGAFPKILVADIKEFPLPNIDEKNRVLIEELVSAIHMAKSLNSLADTSKEEQKIDLLVYKLYGLTYDEVLIVDPQTPISREEYEKIKS